MSAKAWLVGAGPGDPELLTRRAERVLGEADLVLYDALVDTRILALAPRAQRFPVGKRGGKPSFEQRTIEALMIRAARAGKTVVRLKAGDPFVFGRGGEEVIALEDAGIEVEVVPGLSSAIAAPAAAGIPVTHRGLASGFVVLTGFPEETWRSVLAALPPHSLTLVFMMALGSRAAIVEHLVAHGWRSDTPAAIVHAASTREERQWVGDARVARRRRWRWTFPASSSSVPSLHSLPFRRRSLMNRHSAESHAATYPAPLSFADEADVDRFVHHAREVRAVVSLTPDEWRAFRLVHGTYGQRQEGDLSMIRAKIPQGEFSRRCSSKRSPTSPTPTREVSRMSRHAPEFPAPFHPARDESATRCGFSLRWGSRPARRAETPFATSRAVPRRASPPTRSSTLRPTPRP